MVLRHKFEQPLYRTELQSCCGSGSCKSFLRAKQTRRSGSLGLSMQVFHCCKLRHRRSALGEVMPLVSALLLPNFLFCC